MCRWVPFWSAFYNSSCHLRFYFFCITPRMNKLFCKNGARRSITRNTWCKKTYRSNYRSLRGYSVVINMLFLFQLHCIHNCYFIACSLCQYFVGLCMTKQTPLLFFKGAFTRNSPQKSLKACLLCVYYIFN